MAAFRAALLAAATVADLEKMVHVAIGSSELREFVRCDDGQVLRKGRSGDGARLLFSEGHHIRCGGAAPSDEGIARDGDSDPKVWPMRYSVPSLTREQPLEV